MDAEQPLGFESKFEKKKKKNSDDKSPQGISDMSFLSHSPLAPFTAFMKGYKVG